MDFTYFIQNKEKIEVAEKAGLYAVMQSHIPKNLQAFRAGLAGRNVDSATQFKSAEGNFSSRFAQYLQYWMPTDAKVYACLTVPRRSIMGFAERVMPEQQEGDNREPYQLLHMGKTLIEIREKQYHQLLVKYGMNRLGMPGTEESRKRGEFFRGPLETCIKALKEIGTGNLYLFESNDISKIKKIELRKRGVNITPDQVALRSSPRFSAAEDLIEQMMTDAPTQRAMAKLADIRPVTTPETTTRRSPRLEGLEIVMDGKELDRLRKADKRAVATVQQLARIRRSPRLQNI
jgi:hypothetical protein